MNSIIIAIMILVIGLVVFLLLRKAGVHYYVLVFVFLFTMGIVCYAFNDTVRLPTEVKNEDGMVTIGCDNDFILTTDKNGNQVCYNESPFGHAIVSLFSLLAGVFGLSYVTQTTIKSWRMYLTPKMLFYINKYLPENRPINKNIDTYRSGDFIWAYKGYGAIVNSIENEIFVAKRDMVAEISNLLMFKGKAQKITSSVLFEYIGKNEFVFQQIMHGYSYYPKTHKLSEKIADPPIIYIPIELKNGEKEHFYSIKGNYKFNADRSKSVIRELFKMRKAIKILNIDMTTTSGNTLATAVTISDKASVIGDRVNQLRKEEIFRKEQPQQQQQQYDNQQQRRQM